MSVAITPRLEAVMIFFAVLLCGIIIGFYLVRKSSSASTIFIMQTSPEGAIESSQELHRDEESAVDMTRTGSGDLDPWSTGRSALEEADINRTTHLRVSIPPVAYYPTHRR
ncbi:hypothetical protein BDW22DRAFT_1426601 [Trametopsis cervina]|nr:hypothetical protein BDW22DRAFT_1426601 [Trametopsis cervina]